MSRDKPAKFVLLFMITLCVFGFTESTALAQQGSGAEAKADEATLFPVPDFTSGLWQRSRLTGDWGGLRTRMANNGIQFDADTVHLFQSVTSGGVNRTGRYIGTAEIALKLDSSKMGLWPGGFLLVRGEASFGTGVNSATGALMPVNTEAILQLPARDEMVLTHVVFTQFLSEKFGVAIGKLDTTVGDANEFAHGRGDEKFMNLAFSFNPVSLRTTPYSTLGLALVFLPTKDLHMSFSVIDTEGTTTRTGFDTIFKDGTTLAGGLRWTINRFGLTGHQTFGALWSNKTFNSLNQDPRFLIRNVLLGTPLRKESGSWGFMYNFDQYLIQEKNDPSQGLGIFGRFGISDGDANPVAQFYSFGFGGKGVIPGRDQDRFGIGYYYLKVSGDLRRVFPPLLRTRIGLDHGQGVELFYNIAVTPWLHVTPDLQFIDAARNKAPIIGPERKSIGTAVVAGLRVKIDF
jgi:porin